MSRRQLIPLTTWVAIAAVVAVLPARAPAGPPARRPNVVLIVADDLGWGSLGCYGADPDLVQTPSIDRLAREGRRFTDASAPATVCSPTRYAILTGRYCWRTTLKAGTLGVNSPLHIEPSRPTIASALRDHGYDTACVGKWHLGFGADGPPDYTRPLEPGPLQVGFGHFFGISSNHGDSTGVYLDTVAADGAAPAVTVAGLRSKNLDSPGAGFYGGPILGLDAPQRVDDEVMTVLADRAVEWIGRRDERVPFFLLFAPVALHEPITPSRDLRGTSRAGHYGDWIHDLDRSVGRILAALEARGCADDTLVILTSDNGGENRYGIRAWAGCEGDANKKAIAAGLAMNGPWRGGKYGMFEGGSRVPFLVRWPGHVPAGTVSEAPISLVDLFATLCAIAGAPVPPPGDAAPDSLDMGATFTEAPDRSAGRHVVVTHGGDGTFAIRRGPWKWIEGVPTKKPKRNDKSGGPQPALYNLDEDPAESRDVAASHPEVVAELSTLLDRYRDRAHTRD